MEVIRHQNEPMKKVSFTAMRQERFEE